MRSFHRGASSLLPGRQGQRKEQSRIAGDAALRRDHFKEGDIVKLSAEGLEYFSGDDDMDANFKGKVLEVIGNNDGCSMLVGYNYRSVLGGKSVVASVVRHFQGYFDKVNPEDA